MSNKPHAISARAVISGSLLLLAASLPLRTWGAATFYLVDDGSKNSYLTCLSADGRYYGGVGSVAGPTQLDVHFFKGALASLRAGVTNSPALTIWRASVGPSAYPGNLAGLSRDGTFAVGETDNSDGSHIEAFRWSEAGGVAGLGDLDGGSFESYGKAISADGQVVAGIGASSNGYEAFRWSADTRLERLAGLPGATEGGALAISADGTTVAGHSGGQAVVWTPGGIVNLGPGSAVALSPDGRIAVGYTNAQHAFRWSQAEGLVDLGQLPSGQLGGRPYGLTADGNTVVGQSVVLENGNVSGVATIWDPFNGMRDLLVVLTTEYGINLPDLRLLAANAISADGTVVLGEAHTVCPPGPGCSPASFGFIITGLIPFRGPTLTARLAGETLEVTCPTLLGKQYTLESKISLSAPNWTTELTKPGNGGTQTWTNPEAKLGDRFYRVRVH
jgi:uncharacterized membrane protein